MLLRRQKTHDGGGSGRGRGGTRRCVVCELIVEVLEDFDNSLLMWIRPKNTFLAQSAISCGRGGNCRKVNADSCELSDWNIPFEEEWMKRIGMPLLGLAEATLDCRESTNCGASDRLAGEPAGKLRERERLDLSLAAALDERRSMVVRSDKSRRMFVHVMPSGARRRTTRPSRLGLVRSLIPRAKTQLGI